MPIEQLVRTYGHNQQNPLIPFGRYFRHNEAKIIR